MGANLTCLIFFYWSQVSPYIWRTSLLLSSHTLPEGLSPIDAAHTPFPFPPTPLKLPAPDVFVVALGVALLATDDPFAAVVVPGRF